MSWSIHVVTENGLVYDEKVFNHTSGRKTFYLNGNLVYSDFENNLKRNAISEKMAMEIIKYRLRK